MIRPGDVVVSLFIGAVKAKWRPTVVVSSDLHHATRLDVVVAELTTQVAHAGGPTDYVLQDWSAAKLHCPSAFRASFEMVLLYKLRLIGHLSDRDWQEVQARLRLALAVT
jgi:mRNA-degrading endonuclease toxin of MazEF toxin-antitoxin module